MKEWVVVVQVVLTFNSETVDILSFLVQNIYITLHNCNGVFIKNKI